MFFCVFLTVLMFLTHPCIADEAHTFGFQKHIVYNRHEDAGFFACFNVVLGALDAYDKGDIVGFTVDFETTGLYYDKAKGRNWWEYYYKRLSLGEGNAPRLYLTLDEAVGNFGFLGAFGVSRIRGKFLIDKYLQLRSPVQKKVYSFIQKKLGQKNYVAIHYRGTDKFNVESTRLSEEQVCEEILKILIATKKTKWKIFVATDTASFLHLMKKKFGKKVVYIKADRSKNGVPVHFQTNISGYKKGLDALVDCLILSRSSLLIRTASNLSNAALVLNPQLEAILLNKSCSWQDR
jgi:hypothetical protein